MTSISMLLLTSGFVLTDMAKRFLLGRTSFIQKVVYSQCNLFQLKHISIQLNINLYCAATNIPSLFHAKIIVLQLEKIHGVIEVLVILVQLQWNLREGLTWILLEVLASIIHLHLRILLKRTKTCKKGFLSLRKALHALLPTVITHYVQMSPLRHLLLKHLQNYCRYYLQRKKFDQ